MTDNKLDLNEFGALKQSASAADKLSQPMPEIRPLTQPVRRVTLADLNAGLPVTEDVKAVYLVFGLRSEKLNELPQGRWQAFANDEAAKESTVYVDYDYAVIADSIDAKPRLLWTRETGWQEAV
jgi:hypothetical protein